MHDARLEALVDEAKLMTRHWNISRITASTTQSCKLRLSRGQCDGYNVNRKMLAFLFSISRLQVIAKKCKEVFMGTHLRATERHLPHGITQRCYLAALPATLHK